MKKLIVILLTTFALAACGDGTKKSEADRNDKGDYTNTEPSFESENNETDGSDTTRILNDTTEVDEVPSR